jgi:hypothetical protein
MLLLRETRKAAAPAGYYVSLNILYLCCCCCMLLLQDLRRAHMVLWVDDPAAVHTNATAPFFDAFAEFITIRQFNYQQVRQQTLLGASIKHSM